MKLPTSLRARLTLFFAGAVLATSLLHAGLMTVVLVTGEWIERRNAPPGHPLEDLFAEVWPVLGVMALTAPCAVLGAAALGHSLARRALAPMREASARAQAARASALDLRLPVRGLNDEWDELASTLNGLLTDARGAFERIRHFTADAAHELRTPLTIIVGETDVALRRERSVEEYRGSLEVVREESRGLAQLVDALLTLARADAGQLGLAEAPVDLYLLAQQSIQRAERLAPPRVRIVLAGGPTPARGDALLLARVLDNLLANALRYGQARVRVDVRVLPGRAEVVVADDGAGVDPALVPRLFQRFARADSSRREQGTGLGLTLSRALVEAHRGTLDYSRSPTGESLFTFCLPLPGAEGPDASPGSARAERS